MPYTIPKFMCEQCNHAYYISHIYTFTDGDPYKIKVHCNICETDSMIYLSQKYIVPAYMFKRIIKEEEGSIPNG